MKHLILSLFICINVFGYTDSELDSLYDNWGMKDKQIIPLPTMNLKGDKNKVTKRLEEFNIKSFTHGDKVELKKVSGDSRFEQWVLLQNGMLVDSRSMIEDLAEYEQCFDHVIDIYKNVKGARRVAYGLQTGSLFFIAAGTGLLGTVPANLGFNRRKMRYLNNSMKSWEKLIQVYNNSLDSNSLKPISDEIRAEKLKNYKTDSNIVLGIGYAMNFVSSKISEKEKANYIINEDINNKIKYSYNHTIPSLNTSAISVKLGVESQKVFWGGKLYFMLTSGKTKKYISTIVDTTASTNKFLNVEYRNVRNMIIGGHLNWAYNLSVLNGKLSFCPGINIGMVRNTYGDDYGDESVHIGDKSMTIDYEMPYFEYQAFNFGGPEMSMNINIKKLQISVEYNLNLNLERFYYDQDGNPYDLVINHGFAISHTIGAYLSLRL